MRVKTCDTPPAENPETNPLVLDTNVLIDIWVFACPVALELWQQAQGNGRRCLATQATRTELERVLTYAHLQVRMASAGQAGEQVLAAFDAAMTLVPAAPRTQPICRDPDDQKFVDLAVQHQATLVSQDKDVLRLAKRLAQRGVRVLTPYSMCFRTTPCCG